MALYINKMDRDAIALSDGEKNPKTICCKYFLFFLTKIKYTKNIKYKIRKGINIKKIKLLGGNILMFYLSYLHSIKHT